MFLLVIILFVMNIELFFNYINNFLIKQNIDIRFFKKTVSLLNSNAIDNGRYHLYNLSWESFKMHPIMGNGIAAFDRLHGLEYEHSVILQLLNELGLVFSFVHIFLILKGLLDIYKFRILD